MTVILPSPAILFFIAAAASALIVPIALSVKAGSSSQPQHISSRERRQPHSGPPHSRTYRIGFWAGVAAALVTLTVFTILDAHGGIVLALFAVACLTCWVINRFVKPSSEYTNGLPWGLFTGLFVIPCILGLALIPVFALLNLFGVGL